MGIITGIAKAAAIYSMWGIVTVCDPHLVSDEAADKSEILNAVRIGSDMLFCGMKLCFLIPKVTVEELINGIRKVVKKD